ncbi:MATE family efflux transporter [Petrocella atlantisensis]|uniref:MATE family efflux transporter n=1 Tax=Petrocella atlantisensis TaxID=2173034 RepID=A0A3P7NYZ1_9FIRM|nr:MATE family efflux transporter [Petrocella atlantisensis]VDN48464.1 MATE family efflux transporter [Petrocella atlantisensis]
MEKSLLRNFGKYVSLNILGMMGLSCYILADTYFVSKALGSIGIASLNISISIYSMIHGIGLMIGIGGATRFCILQSQNKAENSNIIFTTAIKIGILMGVILAFVGLFGGKNLALILGADALTLPLIKTYLSTVLIFAPFFITNNVMIAFIRNDNNPKLSMIAMLIGSFSNIALDYLFMFPLNMGMFGAALATGLAPIISIFILQFHFIKKTSKLIFLKVKMVWSSIFDIFGLGLSSLIIEVSSAVTLITFNIIILDIEGNLGVAAYGIVANLALVAIAIFSGLAQGTQPLVSKYFGIKEYAMVKKVSKYALLTAVAIANMMFILLFVYSESIIGIFNSENNLQVAQMAESGLKIYFMGFFFAGINIVITMLLSATEKIKDALRISISRGFLIIVPLVIIMSRIWHMNGVWFAFIITEILVLLMTLYFKKVRRKSLAP